ncbi:YugN-like family protein [Evansella caseinilytica]|uniref:YugN-like family protein n=1 Tax=Evansella caseinilytica TaxID=1503961 RepID=A0A1H3TFG7_9BACI|nr:YugN-like family protein [Evansella caseinilytica]SDZ49043.1 YugN-like family protein [Evansella caseinilytica]
MIEVQSAIENREFLLYDLEKKLKPLGYVIGGGWDYDHGYFDYKLEDNGSYLFVRLPFSAVNGELDTKGVHVRLGRPFLFSHQYERNLDHDNEEDPNPLLNQFSAPENPDAPFPSEWIAAGREHVRELEQVILYDPDGAQEG